MAELKPCPFCGRKATIYIKAARSRFPNSDFRYFPSCVEPSCLGRNLGKSFDTFDNAKEAWNKRVKAEDGT